MHPHQLRQQLVVLLLLLQHRSMLPALNQEWRRSSKVGAPGCDLVMLNLGSPLQRYGTSCMVDLHGYSRPHVADASNSAIQQLYMSTCCVQYICITLSHGFCSS